MNLKSTQCISGNAKGMVMVMGMGAIVAMGVLTAGHAGEEPAPNATGTSGWLTAPITKSTAPTELATPFASPTHIATPCPKRATMPC